MSKKHTTELEPLGNYPPYSPPARHIPLPVKFGTVLVGGAAIAAGMFGNFTRGPSDSDSQGTAPDIAIAPVAQAAQTRTTTKSSPHAASPQRASKRLAVEAAMAAGGSVNKLDLVTKSFKAKLQLQNCSARAIRKVENLAVNPSGRSTVWLLNAAMNSDAGIIQQPKKFGIDCKSIGLLLPKHVTIDAPRTEAITTLLSGGQEAADDLLDFDRTKAGFATYQNEIKVPKFDLRIPTVESPRDLLDLGYEQYVQVTDDTTLVSVEFDKFISPEPAS